MEFGIFNSLYVPHHLTDKDPEQAEHNRLMDEVAWVQAADRSGFKYTWATEHHFLQEYSHLSANESFLAFVAGRTSRIHIGSGIFNITPPVNPPPASPNGWRCSTISPRGASSSAWAAARRASSSRASGSAI